MKDDIDLDLDRKPKWDKWKLIRQVELWQAIALSLNIEPSKVKYKQNSCMGSSSPFDEGETFIDRLEVLRQHSLNQSYFPTPCTLNIFKWYFCCNRLDEFSAWCIHVGYEIPDELKALAIIDKENCFTTNIVNNQKPDLLQNSKTQIEWTSDELEDVYQFYINEKNVKKTRAFMRATAEHFGVTSKRIEQLLKKREKNQPNSFGLALRQLIRPS